MQDSPTLIKPRPLSLWNVSKNLYLFLEPRTFAHKTVLRRKITTMATAATNPTYHLGTGRRKSSIARIRLCDGDGQITVNKRPLDEYFPRLQDLEIVRSPLHKTDLLGSVNCHINVIGGGLTGQAGAIMLGIGRALKSMRPDLEPVLREHGFLTRDSRMKERKKYGQKGARKGFQFSKR